MLPGSPKALLARLVSDERGTSVIELAIVSPFITLLLLGTVDLAMGFSAKLALEQSAARAVESATAQDNPGAGYDYLRAEAATASGQPTSNVTLDSWLECNGTRQSSFSGACTSGQQIARYVSVRINGVFTPMFNYAPLAQLYGGHGMGNNVAITGDAVVRVQ